MYKIPVKYSAPVLIAASAAVTAAYVWYRYRNRDRIPSRWKLIGYVDKIAIYPVKSCNYRELDEAECTEIGLKEIYPEDEPKKRHLFRDREFLIYNVKEQEVLHLMKNKKAVLITAYSPDKNTVTFQAPNVPDHQLQLSSVIENAKRVKVGRYGFPIETVDCGDDAAKWISNYLAGTEEEFRMGFYVENISKRTDVLELMSDRNKQFPLVYKHMRENDGGLYSWITSYLVVNKSSFDEINNSLAEEDQATSSIYNFRPNIIVAGCEPFVEDRWNWIKLGDQVVVRYFKPCTRCTVTTINPNTGEMNKNLQPFRTLKKHRKVKEVKGYDLEGDLPVFGASMGLYVPGRLKVGDPVYAGF